LVGHEVETVPQAGWSGLKNGELLRRAASRYQALITADKHFAAGDPVPEGITLIALAARSNALEALLPLVPATLKALAEARGGERVRIG
jgi:hypothetical protein